MMTAPESDIVPKVFISYSWSSKAHQDRVTEWAQRLLADGVDVILDRYDLKTGHDKYAFMERMVTDPTVTHVLIVSDRLYSEKADERRRGVGTETQLISEEVYNKVEQSKFIPLVCEFTEDSDGEPRPCLPAFLRARIWLDFSTPEAVNEYWEELVRLLYDKPLLQKPQRGPRPKFLEASSAGPALPMVGKFSLFKQAFLQDRKGIDVYRSEFLDSCIVYADALRVRSNPDLNEFPAQIVEKYQKLIPVRDYLVDWILLEASGRPTERFSDSLEHVLEQLLELASTPTMVGAYSEVWFEAHKIFAYETFLYIVAALLKAGALDELHQLFSSHILLPQSNRSSSERYASFGAFYYHSDFLNQLLAPPGQQLHSPIGELMSQHAARRDIPLLAVIEAEAITLVAAALRKVHWYPQTFYYIRYADLPLFVRATRKKHFRKLARILGVGDGNALRARLAEPNDRFEMLPQNPVARFGRILNLDQLDTLE